MRARQASVRRGYALAGAERTRARMEAEAGALARRYVCAAVQFWMRGGCAQTDGMRMVRLCAIDRYD